MTTFNTYVGFIVSDSDVVIISKSVLPDKSIRYDMEFEFTSPNGYSVYTWNDKFHDEFSVIFEHLSNSGSHVTKKDDIWVLVGPCITRTDNGIFEICNWFENPLEYDIKDLVPIQECEKSPYEVLTNVIVTIRLW